MKDFEYLAPATLDEALGLLGRTGARPLAGGTDLVIQMRAGVAWPHWRGTSPKYLVDLAGLGLSYILVEAGMVKIGAMTTVADLLASDDVQLNFTCLAEAGAEFGAIQCRNMATVGGNLCSAVPSADLAPPLLVLDAQVRIVGRNEEPPHGAAQEIGPLGPAKAGLRERVMALEHFFAGPKQTVLEADEILVDIHVPVPPPRTGTSFMKLGRRKAMTLAIVSTAALVSLAEDGRTVEGIRIALGAVAPTPLRARRAEAILQGRELSQSLIDDAASLAVDETAPISDLRATAGYRREVSRVLVKRTLLDAWRKAAEQRTAIRPERRPGETPAGAGLRVALSQPRARRDPATGGGDGRPGEEELITLSVNGRSVRVKAKPHALLVDVLRDQLGLIGTKKGCGTGECGACTVLLDGRPINACLMLALQAQHRAITTIEGVGTPEDLHPLQEAFVTHGAVQCGFCAPGMLLSAIALLDQNPHPTEQEIRSAIAGNICRCTGYVKIVESVKAAAQVMVPGGEER